VKPPIRYVQCDVSVDRKLENSSEMSKAKEGKIIQIDDILEKFGKSFDDVSTCVTPHEMDIPEFLRNRLFAHQRAGVDWLYNIHQTGPGGILGDDMGLGKTFQVACLLCGLMRNSEIKRVLIVCPVSVIQSWLRETNDHIKPYVNNCCIDIITSDMSKKKRECLLRLHHY
jgi:SNF2 family DNA or RNA helicase